MSKTSLLIYRISYRCNPQWTRHTNDPFISDEYRTSMSEDEKILILRRLLANKPSRLNLTGTGHLIVKSDLMLNVLNHGDNVGWLMLQLPTTIPDIISRIDAEIIDYERKQNDGGLSAAKQ